MPECRENVIWYNVLLTSLLGHMIHIFCYV